MHDITLESFAAVADHIADAFKLENAARVYMTLWQCNDVRRRRSHFVLRNQVLEKGYLMFKRHFQHGLC